MMEDKVRGTKPPIQVRSLGKLSPIFGAALSKLDNGKRQLICPAGRLLICRSSPFLKNILIFRSDKSP
jgi:hypothetical protein